jgi:cellulose synthase/poly-beta-1,6-N-acetylglucosamine synthase-like glycosyltransferase
MLGHAGVGEVVRGMGLYWRIEKSIREMESRSGSAVGATGALYAVRRNLWVPIPAGTILDDVYIPMHVVRQGFRVVFVARAYAWDVERGSGHEFWRKVRTLGGNYQLLQLAPWLLTSSNPIRFEFISHKLMRLMAPAALIAALVACVLLPSTFYRLAFWLQVLFYGLAALATTGFRLGPLTRISDAAHTFVVLHTAAAVAFAQFVSGRKPAWLR